MGATPTKIAKGRFDERLRQLVATMVFLLCAPFAGAESKDESGDTSKDCLEGYGDTACKPMRDEGNMNSACTKAAADCWEKAPGD